MDPLLFDYPLDPDRIAQEPAEPRDGARLMALDRTGLLPPMHLRVADLPELLRPGDLLVANDAKVLAARLACRRATGGLTEVLLVRALEDGSWRALVRSEGKVHPDDALSVDGAPGASIRVLAHEGPDWTVRIEGADPFDLMLRAGKAPLPPYIKRPLADDPSREADLARYQTAFASAPGAVAAPTAGLHFTPELLSRLRERGIGWATLTLHVGPGTFRTEAGERPDPERFAIPAETIAAVERAKASGKRVIAVGTTTSRALETWGSSREPEGWTGLVVEPGFAFRVVDGLMTNFHLPRTSLLALVCAFAGRERVLEAYGEAQADGYRFYSYGDAMLIL